MSKKRCTENGKTVEGIVTLLLTPFTESLESVDFDSLHKEIEFVLEKGVSSLVACGKAGEFEGMTLDEIEEVISFVVQQVDGRVPVGMGIISVELDEGIKAAEIAARCGADFAMVKKLSKDKLFNFFHEISERIPVMLYDQTNEGDLDMANHVIPLVNECQRIIGVKVSGNVYTFSYQKKELPDTPLICGWDLFSLLAYRSGSDGVVAGSAAFMPEREVQLHQLIIQNKWQDAADYFYEKMMPYIFYATHDPYAFSVSKLLLKWRGIIDSPLVRPPYIDTPEWMIDDLKNLAKKLNLIDN